MGLQAAPAHVGGGYLWRWLNPDIEVLPCSLHQSTMPPPMVYDIEVANTAGELHKAAIVFFVNITPGAISILAYLLVCLARLLINAAAHLLIASELHRRANRQPLFKGETSSFSHLKCHSPRATTQQCVPCTTWNPRGRTVQLTARSINRRHVRVTKTCLLHID